MSPLLTVIGGAARARVPAPSGGGGGGGSGGALDLTLSGSSQTLDYAEPLGAWPDGSARTLFVQFTRSMTNGTPVSGSLTVKNRSIDVEAHRWGSGTASTLVSFGVPLQQGDIPSADFASYTTGTRTDDSATWSNTNTTTWYTGGAGIPAGVLWPTSATHLCAASSFGPLVAQSAQPSFTGSSAADAALESTVTSTALAWDGAFPYGGASYERAIALFHLACRTADVSYLQMAVAHASRFRSAYWSGAFSGLPEQEQAMRSWLFLYLFRRDTGALNGLKTVASAVYINGSSNVGTDFHANNPRFNTSRIKAVAAALKCGLGSTQNNYTSGTYSQMAAALVVEGLATGTTKLTQTDGRVTLEGYTNDGSTKTRTVYPYMAGLYVDAFIELLEEMPSSTNKTNMLAQLSTSVDWLRTNMASTSSGGSKSYLYQDVNIYYQAVGGTLTAGYTAGSTSISIDIDTGSQPPTGWPVSTFYSGGCVLRIGGVSKTITGSFTTNSSGQATVTLEAGGFASSYSSGQAFTFMRDAAVGVNSDNVDLNGFLAPIFAWRSLYATSSTDADEARALLATIGYSPRDGNTGPFISAQKQWDESFHMSQTTWSYLAQSGL